MILDWKRKSENKYESAFNVAIRDGFCGDCRYTLDPYRCERYDCYNNSVKIIADALDKQIPKKPILKNGETLMHMNSVDKPNEWQLNKWQDWICPVCGWLVGQRFNASKSKHHGQRKCNYCNECGQAIDWEE